MNFGASARRISEMAGRFVEVNWPIFFVLVLLFLFVLCSYLSLFYPIISLMYRMPSPAKSRSPMVISDLFKDSLAQETIPRIVEIIGFLAEKHFFRLWEGAY